MTTAEIKSFLGRFDGFDGALIQSIAFNSKNNTEEREVVFRLKAFCAGEGSGCGWRQVTVRAFDGPIFGWIEAAWNTNLVLNYPAEVVEDNERKFIDFDPLHAVAHANGIKISPFFIGGRRIFLTDDGA